MSTINDFKNAPVGATATRADGSRAMKMGDDAGSWLTPIESYLDDEGMVYWDFTLDPLWPAPTTAREALDLTWDLAHEVKPGQVIPEDTRFLQDANDGIVEYTAEDDIKITPHLAPLLRTFDPLPEPEPDWLDAPAVLARLDEWGRDELDVFTPVHEREGRWVVTFSALTHHWSDLRDVTPLYPKEDA